IDSVAVSWPSTGRPVFRLHLAGKPVSELNYQLYIWRYGPTPMNHVVDMKEYSSGATHPKTLLPATDARMGSTDPVCIADDSGWVAYLPCTCVDNESPVYFTADVRWNGTLLDHAGVGWVAPPPD
ncbi:MAG: hypothetical protein JXB13_08180, partial [Phycisphaerae bacterium]|nr:hypothetical protein [Phycisphaerae bacterium]